MIEFNLLAEVIPAFLYNSCSLVIVANSLKCSFNVKTLITKDDILLL